MTDESPKVPPPASGGSYITCTACHCRYHRDLDMCPECGAFPGEIDAPHPERKVHVMLSTVLILILGAALYFLSRNPEAAREAELARTTLLAPAELPDPAVMVVPTPTPLPPPPTPVPVPPPFDPADMGLEPEPTPLPAPTPIPPPSTPTPVPTIIEIREQLKIEMRQSLDERLPLAAPGDEVNLTLQGNRTISGKLLRLEARQFQLESATGAQWIPYNRLILESRLRVDASEREAWLEEKALEEVLNRL